jgi:hypothetical protein
VADELPGLDAFGEALVAAVRREDEAAARAGGAAADRGVNTVTHLGGEPSCAPLPGLDRFGRELVASTRRLDRRRGRARRFGVALGIVLPIAATSGAATAVVLREAVIRPPDPAHVPDEQTPLAGTAVVSTVRAKDPGEALPWTVRVARSKTGFTCTTVGQVREGVFGITGLDGVFRRLPGELSDACGQGGTLTGARVAAADRVEDVRTIVYGAAGEGLRIATLKTARGERPLTVGPGGTFVAVLRGYPEDSAVGVTLRFADGHNERHNFGASPDTLLDPDGGQAWTIERFTFDGRFRCAIVRTARLGSEPGSIAPSACLALRTSDRAWVADARRFRRGDRGASWSGPWAWRGHPARTVVWGVARDGRTLRSVTLRGAGAPRRLTLTREGGFAAVLPASVNPRKLSLDVRLADGRTQRGRPGEGLAPNPNRRPR